MKNKISENLIILSFGWLLFFTTLLTFLIKNDFRSVNSDFMYLPILYNDLVHWGGKLSDWKLTPAPYFFPDMALFFIIEKIFGNYNISMVVAGVVQTIVFILGWIILGETVSFSRESKIFFQVSIFIISSGIMVLGFLKPIAIQHLILTQHFGIMVLIPYILTAGIIILREKEYKFEKKYAFALFALTFLGGISDANIVFQAIIPLAVVSAILFFAGYLKRRLGLILSLTAILGSIAGIVANKLIIKYPSIDQYMSNMNHTKIINALNVFIMWLENIIRANFFEAILVLSALFLNLYGFIFILRKNGIRNELKKEIGFISGFNFFSVLICIFSMVLTGTFSDPKGIDRYLFSITILQLYSVAIWGGLYFNKTLPKIIRNLLVFIAIVLFILTLPKLSNLKKYTNYYPSDIARLDMEISSRGLKNGISHYWDAKYLTMLSKHDLKILQVTPDFLPYHWISNIRWYQKFPPEFIIMDPDAPSGHRITEKSIIDKFGVPTERLCLGRRTVYVYNRPGDTLKFIKDYPIQSDFENKGRQYTYYALFLPGIIGKVEGVGRVADNGEEGYLTYGPPVRLTRGDFRANIFYRFTPENPDDYPGQWDVGFQRNDGFKVIGNGDLVADKQCLTAGFNVDREELIEIRTFSSGKGRLRVEKIVLERIR